MKNTSRDVFPPQLKGKRVLLATESFGPVNGVSRTTLSLVEYLRENGVELAVVAPKYEGSQASLQAQTRKQNYQSNELRLSGYPLPYNPDLTVVYPFRLDEVYRQTFQPDIVYLASPASVGFQLLLQIRQLLRPPVVLLNFQTDLAAYSEILLPRPLALGAVWLLASVQGWLFRHKAVHTVFYPSSGIFSYLEQAGAPVDRLVKLGRGVDTQLFHPSRRDEAYRRQIAPNGEIILVCVCRIAPEKGFEFLAQVAARLVQVSLPFKMLIVGGNRNPAVEAQVRRLFDSVRDHVVFTGFQMGMDLARAYACGDLFLHCSITETFGLVVLEAMASGLPVIARDQGGPSDIVQDQRTGYLVPPSDLDTFVELVQRVSCDENLRTNLAAAARQYADETTWEKINRRVAWRIADAFDEHTRRQTTRRPILDIVGKGYRLIERLRLRVAVLFIWFMWMISVVPLIVHGSKIVPRALQMIRGVSTSK
ncbi:hypothetical protein ASPZODRAFT_133689 [Penicilliopsis zonata CBS 506.65]|uniref:Glycosyl transferase family 1 domain-containing protein n=1 Tax=Penicilliopsis zonata CBS 506.65 TaxID=1073090 RepID=A0A1L9SFA3_9EURO|nr:hypothetical protein ASPZODRAFT_133689 [Penicilliopsis zonata CBS 506.65]OJJ45828.1 hypothetical protein ASPZODRAFT_133689 [Penicilliopsis zonata CBS 506.65]